MEGCKTRNDGSFVLVDHVRTSTPRTRRRATSDATAATVFRGERGIKAEVMSGPEEGEKAKAEMMAVKGPTVLVVVAVVAN